MGKGWVRLVTSVLLNRWLSLRVFASVLLKRLMPVSVLNELSLVLSLVWRQVLADFWRSWERPPNVSGVRLRPLEVHGRGNQGRSSCLRLLAAVSWWQSRVSLTTHIHVWSDLLMLLFFYGVSLQFKNMVKKAIMIFSHTFLASLFRIVIGDSIFDC